MIALAGASVYRTYLSQQGGKSIIPLSAMPILDRLLRGATLYVDYIGKTLLPINLAIYPADLPAKLGPEKVWPALGAVLVLALLTAGAVWRAVRGERWLAVGWFWFLGTLLPTIGLVQAGIEVKADRFTYLPQIGLCIAVAWAAKNFLRRQPASAAKEEARVIKAWVCGAAAILVVIALAAVAFRQTGYWRDGESLWNRALACTETNSIAHYNLGNFLAEHKHPRAAVVQFQEAVSIDPHFAKAESGLGSALIACGRPDLAIDPLKKAIAISPRFADGHGNLGVALIRSGQDQAGIDELRKALALESDHADAHYELAAALLRTGDVAGAIDHFQESLRLAPGNAVAHNNLGVAFMREAKWSEAAAQFQQALQLRPDYPGARQNLQLAQSKQP